MTESEDRQVFEGLDLEEPSPLVDEVILAQAGRLARRRSTALPPANPAGQDGERPARRRLGPLALLGAAALVPASLLLWPGVLLDTGPDWSGNIAEAAPLEAIEELRLDLDQIQEMAELIPPENQMDQAAIEARIRACLEDLERLEMQLRSITESSLLPRKN